MIPNEKSSHYLALTKFPVLLRGITSKNNGNFYCLNCLHSFRAENKLKRHMKVCENKDFCGIVMPPKDNVLKFNQYMKSNTLFELTFNLKKIGRCVNNPEKSSITK